MPYKVDGFEGGFNSALRIQYLPGRKILERNKSVLRRKNSWEEQMCTMKEKPADTRHQFWPLANPLSARTHCCSKHWQKLRQGEPVAGIYVQVSDGVEGGDGVRPEGGLAQLGQGRHGGGRHLPRHVQVHHMGSQWLFMGWGTWLHDGSRLTTQLLFFYWPNSFSTVVESSLGRIRRWTVWHFLQASTTDTSPLMTVITLPMKRAGRRTR